MNGGVRVISQKYFSPHSPSGLQGIVIPQVGRLQGRQAPLALLHPQFFMDLGKNFHCSEISDEFDYGDLASLNLCIIDFLMSWSILSFSGQSGTYVIM